MRKPTHTCWYKVTEDGLKYNHLGDGYDPDDEEPRPQCPAHELAWKNALWVAIPASMVGTLVLDHKDAPFGSGLHFDHPDLYKRNDSNQ